MTGVVATQLKEIWGYRELFYFMVWRDVKVRYKQSVLGVAWAIIQPFGTMVLFTLLFNKAVGIQADDNTPYPIFSYAALLPWTYFSGALGQSGVSLVNHRELLTKVYFPRVAIPSASIIRGLLDFAIASVILGGLVAYYHFSDSSYQFVWSPRLLLWPVLVLPLVMLTLGMGMLFSALNVKYRDVQYILPFMLQFWMFLSPIIYPVTSLPKSIQPYLALNPLTGLIEGFRAALVPTRTLEVWPIVVALAVISLIFSAGTWYFYKTARGFADIV
jgi:lipopolysaccharide transport system permease protein